MNKIEVNNVLDYLALNYLDFKVTDEIFKMWLDELQQYDFEDVMNKVRDMIASGKYNSRPPMLLTIINGLNKVDKKLDWNKQVVLCKHCRKGFNVDKAGNCSELKDHEDRCSSINYVIKQIKKWFNKDITRAELWKMSEQEFKERYDKLLHYIYDHTTNQAEKDVIGYIWNPPSPDIAKKFLNKNLNTQE